MDPYTLLLEPAAAVNANAEADAKPKSVDDSYFVIEEIQTVCRTAVSISNLPAGAALPTVQTEQSGTVTNLIPTATMMLADMTIDRLKLFSDLVPLPCVGKNVDQHGVRRTPIVVAPRTTISAHFRNTSGNYALIPSIILIGYKTKTPPQMP